MNWYKDNKTEWFEIIQTVSSELKRSPLMIEKDTIQSLFLHELSKLDFPFVFKGGTSLSKAYNLIDRFSEDIDLSVSRKITSGEKTKSKKIIIGIGESIGLILANPNDVLSRRDYNKYIFKYNSLFADEPLEIIIETSYFQKVYPNNTVKVKSYLWQFCQLKNVDLPLKFDALIFDFNVQSLERTLVDKIFAVCDYKIENMRDRDSRHLYDIAKIIPHVDIKSEEFKNLVTKVRNDRLESKNNPSAKYKYDINQLLIEIIKTRFFEKDYKDITEKLLYEICSYDEAISKGIKVILESNLF